MNLPALAPPELDTPDTVNLNVIESHLEAGDSISAWRLLPSVVRLELLAIPPFGTPWSESLNPVLDRLTELSKVAIMPSVTKDSDARRMAD